MRNITNLMTILSIALSLGAIYNSYQTYKNFKRVEKRACFVILDHNLESKTCQGYVKEWKEKQ